MLFNSAQFLVFLPIVVVLYFALPHRHRWVLLLAASYYFYMCWKAEYAVLLVISTLIDYYASIQMGKQERKEQRRKFLLLSLAGNLGLLFSFKYFNFFNESLRSALSSFNILYHVPALKVLLPVGISFYTFQTLSYSIDVYRGERKPERHLGVFALYVSFFPQLVAGPIERSMRLLPQFYDRHRFDFDRLTSGLRLMLWGFFKKIVVADRLAILVDTVYADPSKHQGLPLVVATYFFAFQIFCDFSGYTDIAIGSARVLGFDLMENFRRPYFAKSIAEFWQRWHISLSTWFRDYLYIPLGGNRVGRWRWYFNVMTVFTVSGLWHGANWTFVVWGALHGLYFMASVWTKSLRGKVLHALGLTRWPALHRAIQVIVTFHLVWISWVFFRARSLADALYILRHLFVSLSFDPAACGLEMYEFVLAVGSILVLEGVHLLQSRGPLSAWLSARPLCVRWALYYGLILAVILFGQYEEHAFIYFQF